MTRLLRVLPVFALCAVVLAPIPAFAQVSPADAAPYLGSWKLKFEGPMGPIEILLKVADTGGKVTGEMASGEVGKSTASEITKNDKGLTLSFTLDIMGMELPGAITLAPEGAKAKAKFDIMNGAFTIDGEGLKE